MTISVPLLIASRCPPSPLHMRSPLHINKWTREGPRLAWRELAQRFRKGSIETDFRNFEFNTRPLIGGFEPVSAINVARNYYINYYIDKGPSAGLLTSRGHQAIRPVPPAHGEAPLLSDLRATRGSTIYRSRNGLEPPIPGCFPLPNKRLRSASHACGLKEWSRSGARPVSQVQSQADHFESTLSG